MKKLLFATDGSPSAKQAAQAVKDFLNAYPELQVVIVHVSYNAQLYDTSTFTPVTFYEAIHRHQLEVAEEIEKDCLVTFQDWHARIRFTQTEGYPSEQICQIAAQERVDLIVIGSHGKSAVDRLLLGSVSHGVVNHATTPVLVIKERL